MIIGTGLIANALKDIDSESMLFFASGVSNSLETRESEFNREFNLLKNTLDNHQEKKLIYFSTLSINDRSKQNSHYIQHKLKIEDYIQNHCKEYLILRMGNIVGYGGNPNTLFNFLKHKIILNDLFVLHTNARRLLTDINDIPDYLKNHGENIRNQSKNFAYPYYYDLKEIVVAIQEKIGKEAVYKEVNEGDYYKVAFENDVESYFNKINSNEYLQALVNKYI